MADYLGWAFRSNSAIVNSFVKFDEADVELFRVG